MQRALLVAQLLAAQRTSVSIFFDGKSDAYLHSDAENAVLCTVVVQPVSGQALNIQTCTLGFSYHTLYRRLGDQLQLQLQLLHTALCCFNHPIP
jgi:hypothetical protein